MSKIAAYYTYIVKCADHSLYTGYTDDLEKRVRAHNAGKGAKYTRGRLPVSLVFFEAFETKGEAMKKEAEWKRLTRREKLKMLEKTEGGDSLAVHLSSATFIIK